MPSVHVIIEHSPVNHSGSMKYESIFDRLTIMKAHPVEYIANKMLLKHALTDSLADYNISVVNGRHLDNVVHDHPIRGGEILSLRRKPDGAPEVMLVRVNPKDKVLCAPTLPPLTPPIATTPSSTDEKPSSPPARAEKDWGPTSMSPLASEVSIPAAKPVEKVTLPPVVTVPMLNPVPTFQLNEPAKTETKPVEPMKTEAKSVEPMKVETKSVEPLKTEVRVVEPPKIEIKTTTPKTEMNPTEAAKTEETKPTGAPARGGWFGFLNRASGAQSPTSPAPVQAAITQPATAPSAAPTATPAATATVAASTVSASSTTTTTSVSTPSMPDSPAPFSRFTTTVPPRLGPTPQPTSSIPASPAEAAPQTILHRPDRVTDSNENKEPFGASFAGSGCAKPPITPADTQIGRDFRSTTTSAVSTPAASTSTQTATAQTTSAQTTTTVSSQTTPATATITTEKKPEVAVDRFLGNTKPDPFTYIQYNTIKICVNSAPYPFDATGKLTVREFDHYIMPICLSPLMRLYSDTGLYTPHEVLVFDRFKKQMARYEISDRQRTYDHILINPQTCGYVIIRPEKPYGWDDHVKKVAEAKKHQRDSQRQLATVHRRRR